MSPRAESRRHSQHRHAAMKGHAGGFDDHGQRDRLGRGERRSIKSGSPPSPPREPCRSPVGSRGQHRHHRRERQENRHHRRSRSRHDSRSRSRSRSREVPKSRRVDTAPRGHDSPDLIPRYRAGKARYSEPSRRDAARESPTSAKRNRSRSPSSYSSFRKRSRPEHNHSPARDSGSRKRRRYSPHDRHDPSSHRRRHAHLDESKHYGKSRAKLSSSPISHPRYHEARSHAKSRSRGSSRLLSRTPSLSRSPVQTPTPHRRYHSVRRESSPAHSDRYRHFPSAVSGDSPGASQEHRPPPRHAPRPPSRIRRDSSRRDSPPKPHGYTRSDADDDMTSRGGFRGGHNPMYSHGHNASSPPHGASYHNSPSISPYAQYRGGWSGQFSPQQTFSQYSHHGQSSYGAHSGPPEQYHSHNQPNFAPPPYAAPSGPMPSYQQGNFREGYRGGSFRRNSSSGRGGYRTSGPPNPPRGPSKQTSLHKASERPLEDATSRGQSTVGASSDERDAKSVTMESSPSRRASREHNQVVEKGDETKMHIDAPNSQSQNRSGAPSSAASQPSSSSGKFSFSFKSTSKPTLTAPRPEISQRFNAATPRREAQENRNHDREPPRSAPTEPASSRARPDARSVPTGSQMAPPRTRKVKKTVRSLKERPTLPPDLASSESVFFRKPGNESVVGSGTYGKVFKGLNVYTKGLVALKRIRMEGERDGFPVTAVREIKLLQSLRHTNIVKLQEVMVEKNDCFMVFEYLSHDLTGLLNHPSFKLDPAHRKHLAQQLFEGLDYLHTRGVLHRDIKAANILVSSEGVLKLADFGLARFYAKRHQLDYTNRVITIWYRSPELLLGETQYTAAVDVWSAACVMVEIFTQHAIFAGDGTELSQLDKICSIMGTPTRQDWPGLVHMAWFELLRPTVRRKSVFAEKYQEKLTPAAFDLLSAMFRYDPSKRPTAADALQHAYFKSEDPMPRQAVELAGIDGEWHEFESKALRKENERREREARKASKERKRGAESQGRENETKRAHVEVTET